MDTELFRTIALSMPQTREASHMGHPDFRVYKNMDRKSDKGKIFATLLWDDDEVDFGMVKLTPDQQKVLIKKYPKTFWPIKGAWGLQGCTQVNLKGAGKKILRNAIVTAWRNAAPEGLAEELKE